MTWVAGCGASAPPDSAPRRAARPLRAPPVCMHVRAARGRLKPSAEVVGRFPALGRGSGAGRFEVGVAVQLALVEAPERLALRDGHAPVADGALTVARQRGI